MNVAGRKGDGRILRAFEAAKGGMEKKIANGYMRKGKLPTERNGKWLKTGLIECCYIGIYVHMWSWCQFYGFILSFPLINTIYDFR